MATALSVVLNQVREFVNDPETPSDGSSPTWSNDTLIALWNNFVQEMFFKFRPECQIALNGTVITYAKATTTSSTIIIDDIWIPAGINYIASKAFAMDAGDKRDDGRAENHWQQFMLAIQ